MRAAKDIAKVGGFTALHNFNYTTRANISHEIAEQIRARIVCTPAINAGRGLTHMRSMCVGVAETGHRESGAYADGMESVFFIFDVCCTPTLSCRGWRRRRPAKNHKATFLLLALFTDEKRGKSEQGGLAPSSFRTTAACTS